MFIVQESINDEVIAAVILSSDMGKRGHIVEGISFKYENDFERNDLCNDWVETFGEYNINDYFDVSVCHLSEMGEECLGIFLAYIFD